MRIPVFAQLMIIIRLPRKVRGLGHPILMAIKSKSWTGERVNILFMPFPLRTCRNKSEIKIKQK